MTKRELGKGIGKVLMEEQRTLIVRPIQGKRLRTETAEWARISKCIIDRISREANDEIPLSSGKIGSKHPERRTTQAEDRIYEETDM